jgi:hypothetical protein
MVTTDSQGLATAPALTANTVAGSYTVTVQAGSATAGFNLTNAVGIPSTVSVFAGNAQNTVIGSPFANDLQVQVTDAYGNPEAGVPVQFTAPANGASASFAAAAPVLTDAQGIAGAPVLTANYVGGSFTVDASVPGISAPAVFTLVNTAIPTKVSMKGGDQQSAKVDSAYAQKVQVEVTDASGKPVPNITVNFAVLKGKAGAGGSFTGQAVTDANGVAKAPGLAGTKAGSYKVQAWVKGVDTPATFKMTNTAGTAAAIAATGGTLQSAAVGKTYATPLQVQVTDAFGNPVNGAKVIFTIVASNGAGANFSGKGATTTATATTNSSGMASVPGPRANSTLGTFTVTASVAGAGTPASFTLTNTAPPIALKLVAGMPQSTGVNEPFATDLAVLVLSGIKAQSADSGVVVTFTVVPGSSGASASFGGAATVVASTNIAGAATAPVLTANGTRGTFKVIATVAGLTTQLTFELTVV